MFHTKTWPTNLESMSTVSRTFAHWLVIMDVGLSPLIRWPEREELWKTMPQCFKFLFGNKTTVIIDCFGVFCAKPTNLLGRAQTFSSYKHHNTVKVLIGITPQGCISFVSEAWGDVPQRSVSQKIVGCSTTCFLGI